MSSICLGAPAAYGVSSLPDAFFKTPESARVVITRRQLKGLLLSSEGRVMATGRLWVVRGKHLGVGVYEVTLALLNEDSP